MTTKEMQEAILKWKKEQDCCILAHCYQTHDILEVADFVGDSFGLAQKAAQTNCKRVMMCGVRFMAETVKILSPEKQVYLPKAEAGCPMAEQLDVEMLQQMKEIYPEHCVMSVSRPLPQWILFGRFQTKRFCSFQTATLVIMWQSKFRKRNFS